MMFIACGMAAGLGRRPLPTPHFESLWSLTTCLLGAPAARHRCPAGTEDLLPREPVESHYMFTWCTGCTPPVSGRDGGPPSPRACGVLLFFYNQWTSLPRGGQNPALMSHLVDKRFAPFRGRKFFYWYTAPNLS